MAENAENIDPSPTKRPRKPNFTAAECTLLLEVAEQHLDVIKSKFSSTVTNKNKTKVWEEITERVNSLGVCKRTTQEVKEKWRGMVSNAKKEHNKCAAAKRKTGGGKQPDSPKGTTVKLIELFGDDPSFSGISGGIDSAQSTIIVDASGSADFSNTTSSQLLVMPEQGTSSHLPVMPEQGTSSQLSVITEQGNTSHCPTDPEQGNQSSSTAKGKAILGPYTAKGKGKSPLPQRKRVSIDDINDLHFSVLQKESKKLDIEIDNLLLKKREIMLRIQELEARAINPELNFLSC